MGNIPRAVLFYSLLLACAFEISLTCTGKNLVTITKVLGELENWKKLADQLEIGRGDIIRISKCNDGEDCHLRELVIKFCELKGVVPVEDIVATIAQALKQIDCIRIADNLEKKFPGGTVIPSPEKPGIGNPQSPTTHSQSPPTTHSQSHPSTHSQSHVPGTTSPPSSGQNTKPPAGQSPVLDYISKYLTNVTPVEILLGGVLTAVLGVVIIYCCHKFLEWLAPPDPSSTPTAQGSSNSAGEGHGGTEEISDLQEKKDK